MRAPYGAWGSPITADALVQKSITLADVLVDPITRKIYHIEVRPSEGRAVVVDTATGKDVYGAGWNATASVQEHGGSPAVVYGGVVYFTHAPDRRVYRVAAGGEPQAVTPDNVPFRYADLDVHPVHRHLLVAVLEDHTHDTPLTVLTRLVVMDTRTRTLTTVAEGADFYATPKFAPDGAHLAYQEWNHPDMPWQRSAIHVAEVAIPADGNGANITVSKAARLAWDEKAVGVSYPKWLDKDTLIFASDVSGFSNPWSYTVSSGKQAPLLAAPLDQDFTVPSLKLGASPYEILDAKSILFSAIANGRHVLYHYNVSSRALIPVENPYVDISAIRATDAATVVFIACSTTSSAAVVHLTLDDLSASPIKASATVLKSSTDALPFPDGIISQPIPLTLVEAGEPLYVALYPPTNPEYEGSSIATEKPPCVVNVHSGPTDKSSQGLDWTKQYFTSRGWAWLDVDYAGSTGYGRKYIERLNGAWGVTDVDDCVAAVARLAAPPYALIDAARAVIRGASAGGYTTLAALCTRPLAFAAGAATSGLSDLVALSRALHKFQNQYGDRLVGGAYAEIPDVFVARSPVFNAEKIRSPLLILQGLDDAIVPPGQAAIIVKKVREHGGHIEEILFEGEGHGWVKAETIKAALEGERKFFEKVLKIQV